MPGGQVKPNVIVSSTKKKKKVYVGGYGNLLCIDKVQ